MWFLHHDGWIFFWNSVFPNSHNWFRTILGLPGCLRRKDYCSYLWLRYMYQNVKLFLHHRWRKFRNSFLPNALNWLNNKSNFFIMVEKISKFSLSKCSRLTQNTTTIPGIPEKLWTLIKVLHPTHRDRGFGESKGYYNNFPIVCTKNAIFRDSPQS